MPVNICNRTTIIDCWRRRLWPTLQSLDVMHRLHCTCTYVKFEQQVFGDLAAAGVTSYVDNMAPDSAAFDSYLALLIATLRRGRHKLTWKAIKCLFGAKAIGFVGFTVSAAGIAPLCRNLDYVEGLPTPHRHSGALPHDVVCFIYALPHWFRQLLLRAHSRPR